MGGIVRKLNSPVLVAIVVALVLYSILRRFW